MRAMHLKGAPLARLRATASTCVPAICRVTSLSCHCPILFSACLYSVTHWHQASLRGLWRTKHGACSLWSCVKLHAACGAVSEGQGAGARLRAELGGGGEDDDTRGVAHGEAVADALLLLAHALHQRQQVRERLTAPCRPTQGGSLQAAIPGGAEPHHRGELVSLDHYSACESSS